ncbi:4-alpha-glucanotransferase [Corynebacterium occultum]|uniref:4-alpha-glucanotransferase n=1 Tax=Corynebacterium occultum TaxID=2675219 RepID=UPI0018CDF139|nr:4-alpha-glucanotransferase [Corynebacterium occultum]
MTYHDALRELATVHGVATEYWASSGEQVIVSEDTLLKILRALGVELGEADTPVDEAMLRAALKHREELAATRPLPACVVAVAGEQKSFSVHVHDGAPAEVRIILEDGEILSPTQVENWTPPREVDGVVWGEASFQLPAELPLGWHRIQLESEGVDTECGLIITPARLSTTDRYLASPATGVMAQIYSVRSRDSWGMGDFHDLGSLAEIVAEKAEADFLLINPMHAAEPFPPAEDSPYLPTTRRFINPIYLRIEDVPELVMLDKALRAEVEELARGFRELNSSAEIIERNPVYEAKLQVLRELYALPRTRERAEAYLAFKKREGQGLVDFARWCAQQEINVQEFSAHQITPEVDELADFYMWLQFLCDEQLAAAQRRAIEAGMSIGVMADLAVGVHPGGADANNLVEVLAPDASVGAPPDPYNQQGQDWSQPPWHPEKLAEAGYLPWRNLLRTVLRHSGGIRVDHILGLFRLFWMPRMQPPSTGTYVTYDHEALVGILALEAERAGAVVVGEDMGTFEPWVQDVLAERGIMGTSILWFEHSPSIGGPRQQGEYRPLALSSVNTHDLPPSAGYLEGEHIELRERLGVLTTDAADEDAEDLTWQNEILDRIADNGGFRGTELEGRSFKGAQRDERGKTRDLLVGLHRHIAGTPSALTCTSLVDLVGDRRTQNQPGTTKDLYPNWCVPLCDGEGTAVLLEDLAEAELFAPVAEASKRPRKN